MKLEVFDQNFTPLGSIDAFTALRWTEKYNKCGSFELWCPVTPENAYLVQEDNILWLGDKSAAFIEVVQTKLTQQNSIEMNVRGRLIEGYLSYRTIWETYIAENKYPSDVMRDIVLINCITPAISDRKIQYLSSNGQEVFGSKVSFQKTGSDVLSVLEEFSASQNLGFQIDFYPKQKILEFVVKEGIDRTINQKLVSPVVFSSETEDILTSTYFKNKSSYKNVALVAGEGEGTKRKKIVVGSGSGLSRRELFVDARDLQSTTGDGVVIPESEYIKILNQRGLEYLSEKKIIESFDATVKSFGEQQYLYGVDYFKGDLVTVHDTTLNLTVSARITEVERVFDQNGYSLSLIFGYAQPTLNQKLKFLGMEV